VFNNFIRYNFITLSNLLFFEIPIVIHPYIKLLFICEPNIRGTSPNLQSTQNYRKLRKAGITVRKTMDVIIATFCMIEGLILLHADRDFEPIAAHFPLKTCAPPSKS